MKVAAAHLKLNGKQKAVASAGERRTKKGEKLHIKSSAVREPHTPAYRWRISLQPASGGGGGISHLNNNGLD